MLITASYLLRQQNRIRAHSAAT